MMPRCARVLVLLVYIFASFYFPWTQTHTSTVTMSGISPLALPKHHSTTMAVHLTASVYPFWSFGANAGIANGMSS